MKTARDENRVKIVIGDYVRTPWHGIAIVTDIVMLGPVSTVEYRKNGIDCYSTARECRAVTIRQLDEGELWSLFSSQGPALEKSVSDVIRAELIRRGAWDGV